MSVLEGYKMTEIGEIPQQWKIEKLCNLAEFINGTAFKPSDWELEGLPIIRIQNLNGSKEYNYCNKEVEKKYYIDTGELLFSWSGSRGTSFGPHIWKGNRGVLNQHIFKLNISSDIEKLYFYYALKWITETIEYDAHGSAGLVHITKGNLENFKIPVPSLHEQIAIGEILSSNDALITKTDELIEKTKEVKQGLMQELLTKGIGHAEFKDSELGRIPKEWEVKMFKEFTRIIRGASPRPKGDPLYYGGNVPRLMISDVTRDGKYVIPSTDYLTDEGAKKSRPMSKGDLVMSISGTVALPTFLAVDACIHDGFIGFKEIDKVVDKDFLYYQILLLREKLTNSATDGGIYINLTTDIVKEYKVCVPTLKEQQEIASVLSAIDEKIEVLSNRKQQLEEIKQGLMQDLLTGMVRVNLN